MGNVIAEKVQWRHSRRFGYGYGQRGGLAIHSAFGWAGHYGAARTDGVDGSDLQRLPSVKKALQSRLNAAAFAHCHVAQSAWA